MKQLILFVTLVVAVSAADTKTFTKRVLELTEINRAYLKASGNAFGPRISALERYAEVRFDALPNVADKARADLAKRFGVVKGNPRFNCTGYAVAMALELRGRLHLEFWHVDSPARLPASFVVCYVPDVQPKGRHNVGHAVLFVITDKGAVFYDPVAGVRTLSAKEKATLYFLSL